MADPRISVLIPTKCRAPHLDELMHDLADQALRPLEVLLIDDSPDDATANLVPAWQRLLAPAAVRHLRFSGRSLTRARNAGIAASRGEYVVFLDDDIRLRPDFIARLYAVLQTPGAGFAGGCALVTKNPDFTARPPVTYPFLDRFKLCTSGDGSFRANGMATVPRARERVTAAEQLSGGVTIYRREVFDRCLFDEAMSGYSQWEDKEFTYRASRHFRFFYDPLNIVYHKELKDKQMSPAEYQRMYMRNYCYHFSKNLPKSGRAWNDFSLALIGSIILTLRRLPHEPRAALVQLYGQLRGLLEAALGGCRPV